MSKTLWLYDSERQTKGPIASGEDVSICPVGHTHVQVSFGADCTVYIPGDAMFEILEDETNE